MAEQRQNWRAIQPARPLEFQPETVPSSAVEVGTGENLRGWLEEVLTRRGLQAATLLGTADDGVIWGQWSAGRLTLAEEALQAWTRDHGHSDIRQGESGALPVRLGALLRAETLQELRLFAPAGELRVWRTWEVASWDFDGALTGSHPRLSAVWVQESTLAPDPDWTQRQVRHPLVGAALPDAPRTHLKSSDAQVEFTLMRGRAGELHAPPGHWPSPPSAGSSSGDDLGTRSAPLPVLEVSVYYTRSPEGLWRHQGTRWLRLDSYSGGKK